MKTLVSRLIACSALGLVTCASAGCAKKAAQSPTKPTAESADLAPAKAKLAKTNVTTAALKQIDKASAELAQVNSAVETEQARQQKRAKIEKLVAQRANEGKTAMKANQLPQIAPGTIEKQMLRVKVAPGEDLAIQPKWLVKRIKNVAANHDKEAIKLWCTTHLQGQVDRMVKDHAERFWRHMDRYAAAGANGYEVTEERPEGDLMHLTVKARGDIVLKPVMKQTQQGWRFHRF